MASSTKILSNCTYFLHPLKYIINSCSTETTVMLEKGTYSFLIPIRQFKTNMKLLSEEKFTRDPSKMVKKDGTVIRKKTKEKVKINVITERGDLTVMFKDSAETIAKAKQLNLVPIETEQKSLRATYKFVRDADLFQESPNEGVSKQARRSEPKKIVFSSAILDHDINVKVKAVLKNIERNKQVVCIIKKIGNPRSAALVYDKLKELLQQSELPLKILPVSQSETVIQFAVEPANEKLKPDETG